MKILPVQDSVVANFCEFDAHCLSHDRDPVNPIVQDFGNRHKVGTKTSNTCHNFLRLISTESEIAVTEMPQTRKRSRNSKRVFEWMARCGKVEIGGQARDREKRWHAPEAESGREGKEATSTVREMGGEAGVDTTPPPPERER